MGKKHPGDGRIKTSGYSAGHAAGDEDSTIDIDADVLQ